jgi:CspA family cold shock protein
MERRVTTVNVNLKVERGTSSQRFDARNSGNGNEMSETMNEKKVLTGTVISWHESRGFGFIQAASGRNHFAHITNWASDEAAPAIGQKVTFEIVPAEKGPKAVNVRVVNAVDAGASALAANVSPAKAGV